MPTADQSPVPANLDSPVPQPHLSGHWLRLAYGRAGSSGLGQSFATFGLQGGRQRGDGFIQIGTLLGPRPLEAPVRPAPTRVPTFNTVTTLVGNELAEIGEPIGQGIPTNPVPRPGSFKIRPGVIDVVGQVGLLVESPRVFRNQQQATIGGGEIHRLGPTLGEPHPSPA